MNYCSQCGSQLDKDAKFCKGCGNSVKGAQIGRKIETNLAIFGIDRKKVQSFNQLIARNLYVYFLGNIAIMTLISMNPLLGWLVLIVIMIGSYWYANSYGSHEMKWNQLLRQKIQNFDKDQVKEVTGEWLQTASQKVNQSKEALQQSIEVVKNKPVETISADVHQQTIQVQPVSTGEVVGNTVTNEGATGQEASFAMDTPMSDRTVPIVNVGFVFLYLFLFFAYIAAFSALPFVQGQVGGFGFNTESGATFYELLYEGFDEQIGVFTFLIVVLPFLAVVLQALHYSFATILQYGILIVQLLAIGYMVSQLNTWSYDLGYFDIGASIHLGYGIIIYVAILAAMAFLTAKKFKKVDA